MLKRLIPMLLAATLFAAPAFAGSGDGQVFLIHAKTSLKLDDAQICAVPNVALAALEKGYRVVILFDASGVTALKRGGMFGGDKTPLDKASLPERERNALATQLEIPLGQIPHDYGEYIHFLKKRGVELYANRTMMLLYKIGEDQIDQAVSPVTLERMTDLFAEADVYAAY